MKLDQNLINQLKETSDSLQKIGANHNIYLNGLITLVIDANVEIRCLAKKIGIHTNDKGIFFVIKSEQDLTDIQSKINVLLSEITQYLDSKE